MICSSVSVSIIPCGYVSKLEKYPAPWTWVDSVCFWLCKPHLGEVNKCVFVCLLFEVGMKALTEIMINSYGETTSSSASNQMQRPEFEIDCKQRSFDILVAITNQSFRTDEL